MCMGKNMKTIHTVKEFNEICQNNGIQVFLFTTKWCGDCIYIKPFLPSIEKQFDQMNFYELDRDECIHGLDLLILYFHLFFQTWPFLN